MRLSDLKINTYAIVLYIKILNKRVKLRLMEMGITPGTIMKVSKIAPYKNIIGIYIRGYELCISKNEASYIFVEVIR